LLETNNKNENIGGLYSDINEFKVGYTEAQAEFGKNRNPKLIL